MLKHTFKYCPTHKKDEEYMQEMCSQGWAAVKLKEGFWTFQKCEPGKFFYRICYLRGLKVGEVEALKEKYKQDGIEFVSRYSFWAIFRSRKPFTLYNKEEIEITKKIYAPMPKGAFISWLLFILGVAASIKGHSFCILPTALIGVYGSVCTYLSINYKKLLKEIS